MQILIIDNNINPDSWGATEICALSRLAQGATLHVRRAPQDDLPRSPQTFDRIILSGSKTAALEEAPWIDHLDEFLKRSIDANKPILGICYGHQSLARALGGRKHVRRAEQGEFGWGEIKLTPEGINSPFMKGLPKTFHSFQWHADEVSDLVPGMRLLAHSSVCPIQAFQLATKPVFGVQFHPERALERGERSIQNRLKEFPKSSVINPRLGKKLFDPSIGETLFTNFLGLEQS